MMQDSVVQERLIEKYMSLPNEIWDSVIQRATVVSHFSSVVFGNRNLLFIA